MLSAPVGENTACGSAGDENLEIKWGSWWAHLHDNSHGSAPAYSTFITVLVTALGTDFKL